MPLVVVGINHETAPVAVRERVAFAREALPAALRAVTALPGVREAAILSTCNRTELYAQVTDPEAEAALARWLPDHHGLPAERLIPHLYRYRETDAVRHAFRVAAGLDSLVLGEPQILGQFKTAFQDACQAGTVGGHLDRLFQMAFTTAKTVRSETAIGAHPVSVAYAAVRLAHQIFGDLSDSTALLIGAGETVELVARHLQSHRIGRVVVANRTVERANALARRVDGTATTLLGIPEHLVHADIVFSSTASPIPVLGKGSVETALKARKHRPIFMVDLGVPRDIEPEVERLKDVFLYTVDDLRSLVEENAQSRREAADRAEDIVRAQAERFLVWRRSRNAVSAIRAYRAQAADLREECLAKAKRQLAAGRSPEAVAEWLAHTLTNRLTHAPSVQLRQASGEGRDELVQATQELLKIRDIES